MLGDSLVAGVGDTKNGNQGGYVARAAAKLPDVDVRNLGVPGLTARALLRRIDRMFSRGSYQNMLDGVTGADIVVLDLGRNDRWDFRPARATFRHLSRIRKAIEHGIAERGGFPPLVVISVLMLPNRGSQAPWISELNAYILKSSRLNRPADLRFDRASKTLLSQDNIHPTSRGYNKLSSIFVRYLTRKTPSRVRRLQPDSDGDGIPDIFDLD